MMNVLIACEESQTLCSRFRALGFNAFSCDIVPCSGSHPEWHICADVLPILDGSCSFSTMDGVLHSVDGKWDLIIAHPPCTYLCRSGLRWCNVDACGQSALDRIKLRDDALEFFKTIYNCNCDHIALENPIGYASTFMKYSQLIHPYEFGDGCGKSTCLWLRGLPPLLPTNIVPIEYVYSKRTGRRWDKWFWDTSCISDLRERSRVRSVTFPGIADAMVSQWGGFLNE